MTKLEPEEDETGKFYYDEEDRDHWKNNCRPDIGNSIAEEERDRFANKLGPNWASIMSGLGDQ